MLSRVAFPGNNALSSRRGSACEPTIRLRPIDPSGEMIYGAGGYRRGRHDGQALPRPRAATACVRTHATGPVGHRVEHPTGPVACCLPLELTEDLVQQRDDSVEETGEAAASTAAGRRIE